MSIETIKILDNELKLKRKNNNKIEKLSLLVYLIFLIPMVIVLPMMAVTMMCTLLFYVIVDEELFDYFTKKDYIKINNYFEQLKENIIEFKCDLLEKKEINILQLYEYISLYNFWISERNKDNVSKLKNVKNTNEIKVHLKNIVEGYKNYTLKILPNKEQYQIACNFGEIGVLHCTEKDIMSLLSSDKLNVLDLIDCNINYKTPIVQKYLSCAITTKNLDLIKNYIKANKDKQKDVIEFFLTITSSTIEEHHALIIENILGKTIYSTFKQNNMVSTSISSAKNNLSSLESIVAFIDNDKAKLSVEDAINFDFIKKDYERAQSLRLLEMPECINIFKSKFNDFVISIENKQKDYDKKEQSKFMRYLQKAL